MILLVLRSLHVLRVLPKGLDGIKLLARRLDLCDIQRATSAYHLADIRRTKEDES